MCNDITEWGILSSVKVAMSNAMDWFTTARDPIIRAATTSSHRSPQPPSPALLALSLFQAILSLSRFQAW